MEQSSTDTSSDAAAGSTQVDDGEPSVPDIDPKEMARIRSLFPLPLPQDVMTKIEHLAYMNCIREHKRALHREMMDTEIFLTIVNTRTWNGRDYLGAHRIPPLISGAASDSDDWDSDWNSDDEDGMIGWGGLFASSAAGGGGGGDGPGATGGVVRGGNNIAPRPNANDPVQQDLMRMLESRLRSVPHPNQQAAS